MRNILVFLVAGLFTFHSFGAVEVLRRNIKLPSQEVLNKYEVTPLTASANAIINDRPLAASSAIVTSFLAQPDVPRNITIIPGGTTADVAAGNVVVTGVDSDGDAISETLALLANQSTATVGNKAFAAVTSISFPVGDSPFGAVLDVGYGDKIGLNKCMNGAGFFIKGLINGANLTGETLAANATSLSDNTVIPNPAANGSRAFTFLFVQNFRCAE
jgi:hypothetical protein